MNPSLCSLWQQIQSWNKILLSQTKWILKVTKILLFYLLEILK